MKLGEIKYIKKVNIFINNIKYIFLCNIENMRGDKHKQKTKLSN